MENKRIQLKTETARKQAAFHRTNTVLNINSLVADYTKMCRHIHANRNAMLQVLKSAEFDDYLETEPGWKLRKEATAIELRRLRAWWAWDKEFHRELSRDSGKRILAATIMILTRVAERELNHIVGRQFTMKEAGVSPEHFKRITEFVEKNWREMS